MSDLSWITKKFEAGDVFTPSAPVRSADRFAGRQAQLNELLMTCTQPGRHALLFGDRGVGKTSLANVFLEVLRQIPGVVVSSAKETCESADSWESVLARLVAQLEFPHSEPAAPGSYGTATRSLQGVLGTSLAPGDFSRLVQRLGVRLVLVVDEFDRLAPATRKRFADAIKIMSDNVTPITFVLVGVANTVHDLMGDHASVDRALTQIRLSRMSRVETRDVVVQRLPKLGMTSESEMVDGIVNLSQGLPHFTHLLGLGCCLSALDEQRLRLGPTDLGNGIRYAIRQADQSLLATYATATYSPRVDALFTKVLCASAMAETDPDGFFNARQMLPHMQRLHGDHVTISFYTKHLDEFATSRGHILEKTGTRRKYRYRFKNPMMRAYVLLQAVAKDALTINDIEYLPELALV